MIKITELTMKKLSTAPDLNEISLYPKEGPWKTLPKDLWHHISSFLEEEDLKAVILVDHNLKNISDLDLKRALYKQELIKNFPAEYYCKRRIWEGEEISFNYTFLLKDLDSIATESIKTNKELFSVARINNLEKFSQKINSIAFHTDPTLNVFPWEVFKKGKLWTITRLLQSKRPDGRYVFLSYWQATNAQPLLNYAYTIFKNYYGLTTALLPFAIQCRRPIEEIVELWNLKSPKQWNNMKLFWLAVASSHVDMLNFFIYTNRY